MSERVSQRSLEEIAPTLSKRDQMVLCSVRQCRYLTTKQIQRLHFTDAVSAIAGLKAANRTLNKLMELELTGALKRRIGGVRAGSGSRIWYLTDAGERLLRLGSNVPHPRRRFFEPSPHFLEHTLAVSECYLQLTEICIAKDLELLCTEIDPYCHRSYSHKGVLTSLRPDLYAMMTSCVDYEDRWFIEIDMDTQAPITVMEKCQRYYDYYRSGLEQKEHGVFPLVVWIVPNTARKTSITEHIRTEFKKHPRIFIVITPDELEPLIRQGVEGGSLC